MMPLIVRLDGSIPGDVYSYKKLHLKGSGSLGGYFSTSNGIHIVPEQTHFVREDGPCGWSQWRGGPYYGCDGQWFDG